MNKKNIIYVTPFNNPHITEDIQIKMCKLLAKELFDTSDLIVIKDEKDEKTNLREILDNINDYNNIIVYSVIALGPTSEKILNCLKLILDGNNVSLFSFSEPINLKVFGQDIAQNLIITASIANAVYTEDKYKKFYDQL